MGSQFVREEFKRHKNAGKDFVPKFMAEWTVRKKFLLFQRSKLDRKYALIVSLTTRLSMLTRQGGQSSHAPMSADQPMHGNMSA